jgi:hypothetical protein
MPSYEKVAAREDRLTNRLSLSLPSRTLVTLYCKRIRPGRRTTRVAVPLIVSPPCVPSRGDSSGLGRATTIYSSVQGPPGSKRRQFRSKKSTGRSRSVPIPLSQSRSVPFTLQPNKKQSRSIPDYQTQNRAAPFL